MLCCSSNSFFQYIITSEDMCDSIFCNCDLTNNVSLNRIRLLNNNERLWNKILCSVSELFAVSCSSAVMIDSSNVAISLLYILVWRFVLRDSSEQNFKHACKLKNSSRILFVSDFIVCINTEYDCQIYIYIVESQLRSALTCQSNKTQFWNSL